MSVPFKDGPAPPVPDVDALMLRVRSAVADKLGRGAYAPAELDAVRQVERELSERSASGPAAADDIARLHSSWDPLGPHAFTSHRGGVGRLIVAAKQGLRRLALPLAAVTLARQAQFNGAVARLLTGASHGVRSLEAGNDALRRRLDELERRNQELRGRCDELEAQVRGLQARADRDGRGAKPG